MVKRGLIGCARFCSDCSNDCKCENCGYCHSCGLSSAYNAGRHHAWEHNNCNGKAENVDNQDNSDMLDKFLIDTSAKFGEYFESEIFTVKVGEDKTFQVHKDALCQASILLKKQIEADMKETKTKEIELKECTDKGLAFSMFLQFAYYGGYGYDDSWKEDGLLLHAHVYILAERLGAIELKTLALKKATALCASVIEDDDNKDGMKTLQFILPEVIPVIYNNTYDANAGKAPSSFKVSKKNKNDTVETAIVLREKFRILLAKFAAAMIEDLRRVESFMLTLEETPSFATDIILFTGKGNEFKTDGKGNLEI